MGALKQQNIKDLADAMNWGEEFASGYLDGQGYRRNGVPPPRELMQGTNEYALGVQIGYNYGAEYLRWGDA